MTRRAAIRRGDIYLVTYTFPHEQTDAQAKTQSAKERPILILQTDVDNANDAYPLVLAALVTTQKTDIMYEQDVLLPAGEANLRQNSKVLLGLLQPFLKERLGKRVGRISAGRMRIIEAKLLRLFGFVPQQPQP
jgi:mRNA-degrading endonuclease toxin of MazEF toxin-antitoxin module